MKDKPIQPENRFFSVAEHSTGCCALLVAALCSGGCSGAELEHPPLQGDYAFVNTHVIPMVGERVLRNHTVVVSDGVITSITASAKTYLAKNVKQIDGSGRYLIPGLADMHVHLWNASEPPLYIANGVTTVRNMWGEDFTLELREKVRLDSIVGPRIITAGPVIDGAPRIWAQSAEVKDADEARKLARDHIDRGFDFIKVYSNLSPTSFQAIAETAARLNVSFAGHTPTSIDLLTMMRAGPASIEHLTGWSRAVVHNDVDLGTGYRSPEMLTIAGRINAGEITLSDIFDGTKRSMMAAAAAEYGVWNDPTLLVKKNIMLSRAQAQRQFERPEMKYVFAPIRDFWNPDNDFRKKNYSEEELLQLQVFFQEALATVYALHVAGAPLLVGTDAPNPFVFHGFSVHEELALFVAAGLSPYAALEAATAAPARFLNETGRWGVVAVGAYADLVLLSGNPLEDISHTRDIEGVMRKGRWFDRSGLNQLLDEAATTYAAQPNWFNGRESIAGEFQVKGGATVNYRMNIAARESAAERLLVLCTDDRLEVVAQGETSGWTGSSYSLRRSENFRARTMHTTYLQIEEVPSREIHVQCDATSCTLLVDGMAGKQVGGDRLWFLLNAPSDYVALSSRLQVLEAGDSREVQVVWLEGVPEPTLKTATMVLRRLSDTAIVDSSDAGSTRLFELSGRSKGSSRVWIDNETGLPVRIEQNFDVAPGATWTRGSPGPTPLAPGCRPGF